MWRPASVARAALVAVPALFASCRTTPVQLSVWAPIQLFEEEVNVLGVRAGGYARNDDVSGLDVAFLSDSKRFTGISAAIYGSAEDLVGVQIGAATDAQRLTGVVAGILNNLPSNATWADRQVTGAQLGVLLNVSDELSGAQLALLANDADEVRGLQLGAINLSDDVAGLQIGLLNCTDSGGVQIGLLNWKKDGFLPFFPLVNF